jgi:ABC-2 type transport system ATP-binding protein
MCRALGLEQGQKIKTLSKGTREKMQLMLVMSRKAKLYLLDEPIAGVDPAAREFIMHTILTNYNEEGTVLISTHLLTDVEQVLDEAIFLQTGRVVLHEGVDSIRERTGKSVDELFREMFRAQEW